MPNSDLIATFAHVPFRTGMKYRPHALLSILLVSAAAGTTTRRAEASPPSADSRPASGPVDLPPPPPPPSAPAHSSSAKTTSAAMVIGPGTENTEPTPSPPTVDTRFAVAPLAGFGTDDLNFGLGIRVGRMLTEHIYVGGTFVYHFGHSVSQSAAGYTVSASMSLFYVGPEAGYDFVIAPIVLRAYAGLGLAPITASTNGPGANVSTTDTKFVVWPGAQVLYDMPGSSYFVGGDVRFVTVPGGPSFGVFALAGTRF